MSSWAAGDLNPETVSLKDSCSAIELAARSYRQSPFSRHRRFLSVVGEAGVEPAHPSLIRRVPSPFGHSPVGNPGIEPGPNRVSGGPLRPAGSLPLSIARQERDSDPRRVAPYSFSGRAP